MTDKEQIDQFADSLDALIDRHREEYDLSYAAVVGCLQMKIHTLLHESEREAEDRDERYAMDTDEYRAAREGITGADRMALGLSIIPNDLRGDMDEVNRLRTALEYIANDVRCCSLDKATEAARDTLKPNST